MLKLLFNRYENAWNKLRKEARPIVGFELWYSFIYAVVLAAFTAWLVDSLLISNGQIVFSNEDIITFFISMRGVLFILLRPASFLDWPF